MYSLDQHFYQRHRLGSAAWADEEQRRPLRVDHGLYAGLDEQGAILRNPFDAPSTIIAGSGAGKNAGIIMVNACTYPGNMMIVDLKGENAAVSLSNLVRFGKYGYCINPAGLLSLPHHSTDPLDLLDGNSRTLVADAKMVSEMICPLSGSGNAQFWELKSRLLCEACMVADAEQNGCASLLTLYRNVSAIEGEPERWFAFAERMYASSFEHVRRVAAEMIHKQKESPKEASGIVSEATKALSFMDDTALQAGLVKPDFSLKVLCERPANVYINLPAEYLGIWSPYLRLLIGVAMLYKTRHVNAPRVVFIVDEAGQLGRAEFLERAMTFGRGAGITTQAVFQSIGQIEKHYGREGVQIFLSSAAFQQWFGIRDYATAELLSRSLGHQSLEYDAELEQAAARTRSAHIVRELMAGGDPFEAGLNHAQASRAAVNKTKAQRAMLTPDEVLRLPSDRQIVLPFGIGCPPLAAFRKPYYDLRFMAGQFRPNPLHPPLDRVRIKTRFGWRVRRVITEPVPRKYADWPQYQSGEWSFIEGYRPS